MGLFDIILLIVIGGFGLFGLWFGFFHTLGSLLGTVFGVYLASRYYVPLSAWLVETTGWGENVSNVIIFSLAFIIINRLVGLAFWIFDRFFRVITALPFLNSLNRILGLVLGILEGLITVGFIIFFLDRFPISERITEALAASRVAPHAVDIIDVMMPLLPEALRLLRSTVDFVEHIVL